jgi:hypothetical protein
MKLWRWTRMIIAAAIFFPHILATMVVAQTKELESYLKRSFDLSPGYRIGDRDFYRMKTIYLDFGDKEEVTRTSVLEGYFSREAIKIEDGKRTDRFVWKYVKQGTRKGKGEITELTVIPFTKNFDYSFKEGEWTPKNFPVDLTRIPKTMEGWTFFVKLVDAHTFDVLHGIYSPQKPAAHIGETVIPPAENMLVGIDFPPLFTDSSFTNGPIRVTFQGITLYKDESCAVIVFRADDSRVRMTANINNMKLPADGVSYYWGQVFISLTSRKIVWAQILERVDMVTTLVQMNQSMKTRTDREISLEKIARPDFDKN